MLTKAVRTSDPSRTFGSVQTADEAKEFKPITAWGVVIEMDNMSRHEWPVCKELGLPRRVNYRDINATSVGPNSATSQILARAQAEEEQERIMVERALAAKSAGMPATSATNICPKCQKSFRSAILLRNHLPGCN